MGLDTFTIRTRPGTVHGRNQQSRVRDANLRYLLRLFPLSHYSLLLRLSPPGAPAPAPATLARAHSSAYPIASYAPLPSNTPLSPQRHHKTEGRQTVLISYYGISSHNAYIYNPGPSNSTWSANERGKLPYSIPLIPYQNSRYDTISRAVTVHDA